MKNIGQFLAQHIRTIYSVSPQSTVRQALELMADKNIGALLVSVACSIHQMDILAARLNTVFGPAGSLWI